MEQIKVIFFLLASFFGIEESKIAADKNTVTIYPKDHKIEIVQEHLFTIIQTEKDTALTLAQWEQLSNWKENKLQWAKELENFTNKNMTIENNEGVIVPRISFNYTDEKDLRALGIWYDQEKNQYSINNVPREHTTSENGKLEGNYWFFDGDNTYSFTNEAFVDLPNEYKKLKLPISEILRD
ncbi:hypothetical protein [Maribacter ulvicola]|uniref:Uncharacterized protein n=1 Tax=Maribacter ulvicola TaxID=228959 RepID=A0A1N6NIY9_9FLAO|nr:hypothetical protein [Maribacter ulvicola]SIP91987.1 hypothetical protein SAMN05421797_10113 [Maribacter ulvicola]